ncbi:hypothetical protein ACFL49_00105 [Candidatus Omnitrophota bacterium]
MFLFFKQIILLAIAWYLAKQNHVSKAKIIGIYLFSAVWVIFSSFVVGITSGGGPEGGISIPGILNLNICIVIIGCFYYPLMRFLLFLSKNNRIAFIFFLVITIFVFLGSIVLFW